MIIIHKLFEIVGASVVLIGGFLVFNVGLYDLCHMLEKYKEKRIKRRGLWECKERLFKK